MFEKLLHGEIALNEWVPVICIGAPFLLLQLILCFSVCRRLRLQERFLKRLIRNYEAGSAQSEKVIDADRASWLHWVLKHFPANYSRTTCRFTREDALQELDTRIASNGNYLLLQRMGVMAPLLGVVLTVAGFYWLKVGDDEQSLQTILQAVTPLVAGVGTGAVLALINQLLLHVAGRRVESLRLTGRTWFDSVIWQNPTLEYRPPNAATGQALDDFVHSTLDDVERFADTLARATEINSALADLPGRIREIFARKLSADPDLLSESSNEPFVTRLPRTAR